MVDPQLTRTSLISRLESIADGVFRDQIVLLRDLIAHPTVSAIPPAGHFAEEVDACLDALEARLSRLGFVCDRWRAGGSFPSLSARRELSDGRSTIGFNGHLDVVPIEDPATWSRHPWGGDVVDGRLYGRGACDAKGPVVAMVGALQLLDAAGIQPAGHVLLHLVSDEEVAGPCTDECLERTRPDVVIVGEPSALDVWIAEPGLEQCRIEVSGIAKHALNRWRALPLGGSSIAGGVNAIEQALPLIAALRDLEREWTERKRYPLLPPGFNTANLGVIAGGKSEGPGQVNVGAGPGSVPDLCVLEYNIWYYPGERLEEIRADVEARIAEVAAADSWLRTHPPRVAWALRGLSNPPAETDHDHPLVRALLSAARQVKPEARATAMQGASLLPWYDRRNIPGVIFGPGDVADAHQVDESIGIESLRAATLALAAALADPALGKEVTAGSMR